MSSERIRSTKHPLIRRLRDAGESSADALVLDGVKLIRDSLAAGHRMVEAVVSTSFEERPDARGLLGELYDAGVAVHACTDAILAKVSSLKAPQGVLALAERPQSAGAELFDAPNALVVLAAGVRDPGNLGAVIRSAEAAGVAGVVVVDCADPFRDKALRGSAGSALRVPILRLDRVLDAADWLQGLDASVMRIIADGSTGVSYTECDWAGRVVLVVGSEGAGVPDELAALATQRVAVPMAGAVESLNVAVATSILLFEARRQRSAAESN